MSAVVVPAPSPSPVIVENDNHASASSTSSSSTAATIASINHHVSPLPSMIKKNPRVMHVIMIRHGESLNNVLARGITATLGMNPYSDANAASLAYDASRHTDPALSALGVLQASKLPLHPHLLELDFPGLVAAGRVKVVSSPMNRAIMTSMPLMRAHGGMERGLLKADICERGGNFRRVRIRNNNEDREEDDAILVASPAAASSSSASTPSTSAAIDEWSNISDPGLTRAELHDSFGNTHDAREIHEEGWWRGSDGVGGGGEEELDGFNARMDRVKRWIEDCAMEYADTYASNAASSTSSTVNPDFLVLVTHAGVIDGQLARMLRLPVLGQWIFSTANTAIAHVEYEVPRNIESAEDRREKIIVRVKGINVKPHAECVSIDRFPHQSTLEPEKK